MKLSLLYHVILRWGDYSELIRYPSVITRFLVSRKGMQKRNYARVIQFEKCESNVRKTRSATAEFEDGGAQTREYKWHLEDGQSKEMNFSLELPKGNAVFLTLQF